MAIATEEETRQEGAEEIRIADDRELYRAIGRIEGKQEMLVNSARSLEEQARENYRLLDAKVDTVKTDLESKVDTVKTDLESKIDTVKTDLESKVDTVKTDLDAKIDMVKTDLDAKIQKLDDKFNRFTIGIVGGVIVVIVANYLMQYLPRIN